MLNILLQKKSFVKQPITDLSRTFYANKKGIVEDKILNNLLIITVVLYRKVFEYVTQP